MNSNLSNVRKLTITSLLVAVAVVGSTISFPVGPSKMAPVQHMVNVLCVVILGSYYSVGAAFSASVLRLLLGLGSVLAFPGSLWGAFLSSYLYKKTQKIHYALLGEVFGTGILGGLTAYPISILVLGQTAGKAAFYVYVIPFLISTIGGSLLAGMLLYTLRTSGALAQIKHSLNQ
ncbi:MAG: energy coupling factor transporter S component ThiW [Veillonella sp.]|uniref:energy coupling factor transporter S component ThiW n=1 Tax=Veillonella sp. TaxID=1926307 RepID=UPI0025DAC486|nr:energy coupling factor transporter S component ThiW [Veillonella sp.]MBS4913051.1 energy coupling factor transporter S component ThiW [Veillonella sp.]